MKYLLRNLDVIEYLHFKHFMFFSMRFMLFVVFIASCERETQECIETNQSRTILVYMIAENDLYRKALEDIMEMKDNNLYEHNKLLVYIDPPAYAEHANPRLIEIINNDEVLLKQYTEENSISKEMLTSVINDVLLFPLQMNTDWFCGLMPLRGYLQKTSYKLDLLVEILIQRWILKT